MSRTQSKRSVLSYTDIYKDQHQAIRAMKSRDCLLIAPKGYGKAMIGQTAAQEMLAEGHVKRVLIVAPLKVVQLTWMVEYENWHHLEVPVFAIGDASARARAVASHNNIVVTNLDNLAWILNEYPGEFDGVIIDEISKLKAVGGVGAKAMRRYRRRYLKWCCGMSATPVAETGVDLYSQVGIVDNFQALGKNQDNFRRRYFYPTDFNQTKWKLIPGQGEALAEAVRYIVHVADAKAYEDSLPPLETHYHYVDLPPVAREVYNTMCRDLVTGKIEATSEAGKIGKLQQISQGAAYTKEKEVVWFHRQKFEALEEILCSLDGPALISYQFNFERDLLQEMGYDILAADPIGLERAWNAGRLDNLAVHPQSAGHGLNLQRGGHNLVCLGPIWSADQWDQMVGRIWRRGQLHDVHRRVIIARDTVDEIVLTRVAGKEAAEGELMGHLKVCASSVL